MKAFCLNYIYFVSYHIWINMEFQAQIFGIGFGIEIRFFIENLFKDSESGPKGKIVGLGFG